MNQETNRNDALTDAWQNPGREFRSAPFWSWNSKLEPDRLCRAIDSMHAAGMGGFFMHSRYGLKTPYLSDEWFKCVSACVERARELGMKAYLYDEDRWPSGSAGGIVTRKHPEYGMVNLLCARAAEPAENAERLATFAVSFDESERIVSYREAETSDDVKPGETLLSFDVVPTPGTGWHNDGQYLDTMSPDAVAEFIRVTHQAYADRYGEDFGKLVPAIFTDEPNYGSARSDPEKGEYKLVWTGQMPREFVKRRGYDIRQHLPELVFASAEGEFSKVRHDFYRTAVQWLKDGAIGKVKEWHSWTSAVYTNEDKKRPAGADPIPEQVAWDLWLGVAPERPYKEEIYHPFKWRAWRDFGSGATGDFGCHIFDPVFTALDIGAPLSITCESECFSEEVYPAWTSARYVFPGTPMTAAATIQGTWLDGGKKPEVGLSPHLAADHELPKSGSMLIGEEGTLILPHVGPPHLYPEEKFKDYPEPELAPLDHYHDFVEAALGKGAAGANFDFAGPLTEAVLLTNVANRFQGRTLEWDADKLRFTNNREATKYLRRRYRRGWRVRGL